MTAEIKEVLFLLTPKFQTSKFARGDEPNVNKCQIKSKSNDAKISSLPFDILYRLYFTWISGFEI